jgi:hypothetical protein
MSVTTVVLPQTFEANCQKAWSELFTGYFDGLSHTIGDLSLVFPDCDLKFKRQQLPRTMAKPMIIVQKMPSQPDRNFAKFKGIVIESHVRWKIVVVTADAGKIWRVNDQITDLVGLIINGARPELAKSGMKIVEVGQSVPVSDPEYQVSQRDVRVRTMLTNPIIGTGGASVPLTGAAI